jgi:hypothetical protein
VNNASSAVLKGSMAGEEPITAWQRWANDVARDNYSSSTVPPFYLRTFVQNKTIVLNHVSTRKLAHLPLFLYSFMPLYLDC